MTNDDVIYRSRLRLFALAQEMGSVRAACRMLGVHHSTYYRWGRLLLRYGPELLRTRAPATPRAPPASDAERDLSHGRATDPGHGNRLPGLGDRTGSAWSRVVPSGAASRCPATESGGSSVDTGSVTGPNAWRWFAAWLHLLNWSGGHHSPYSISKLIGPVIEFRSTASTSAGFWAPRAWFGNTQPSTLPAHTPGPSAGHAQEPSCAMDLCPGPAGRR